MWDRLAGASSPHHGSAGLAAGVSPTGSDSSAPSRRGGLSVRKSLLVGAGGSRQADRMSAKLKSEPRSRLCRIDARHRCVPAHTALLVVDMQHGFLDEGASLGDVYDKFLDTPLDLALRSRGITHLIVTGVTTDICVNCTVLAAANRNYHVTVATDGVATLEEDIQAACFEIWGRKFARLRTTQQLVAELRPRRR